MVRCLFGYSIYLLDRLGDDSDQIDLTYYLYYVSESNYYYCWCQISSQYYENSLSNSKDDNWNVFQLLDIT